MGVSRAGFHPSDSSQFQQEDREAFPQQCTETQYRVSVLFLFDWSHFCPPISHLLLEMQLSDWMAALEEQQVGWSGFPQGGAKSLLSGGQVTGVPTGRWLCSPFWYHNHCAKSADCEQQLLRARELETERRGSGKALCYPCPQG